ncbi:MAG: hypothetical protein AB7E55_05105 [Pigmentiphaga sp.]
MNKVPVDRELLERVTNMLDAHNYAKDAEALMAALAQPAEAEGVEVVAYAYIDETPEDYLRTKPFVLFAGPDGGAPGPAMAHQRLEPLVRLSALSAVTAERDRLTANIDRLTSNPADHRYWEGRYRDEAAANDQFRAEVERWKIHARNWESVAHKQDRRLKDILRGLASDKALSVFQAPCDIELLPVPCEVIHDDDVLLVIHQRDAAMAAKEA